MTHCLLSQAEKGELLLAAGCGAGQLSSFHAAHLRHCIFCSEACSRQQALWNTLGEWTLPQVSSDFDRELYARIESKPDWSWVDRWTSGISRWFAEPAFAVASVAVVLTAGFVFDHSPVATRHGTDIRSRTMPVSSLHVSSTEAEQVEKTLDDMEMLRQFDLNTDEKEPTKKPL